MHICFQPIVLINYGFFFQNVTISVKYFKSVLLCKTWCLNGLYLSFSCVRLAPLGLALGIGGASKPLLMLYIF